eukprot:scaffold2250_cov399-Prasinococcus_capsulatus_cf.AAC.20
MKGNSTTTIQPLHLLPLNAHRTDYMAFCLLPTGGILGLARCIHMRGLWTCFPQFDGHIHVVGDFCRGQHQPLLPPDPARVLAPPLLEPAALLALGRLHAGCSLPVERLASPVRPVPAVGLQQARDVAACSTWLTGATSWGR